MSSRGLQLKWMVGALLLAGLACNFGASAPTGPDSSTAPPVEAPSEPTPAPENTAPVQVEQAGDPAGQFLDLDGLPLGGEVAPNYSEHLVMTWEGTGLDGQPLLQEWDFLTHWFSQPEQGYNTRIEVTENGNPQTLSETAVFGGQSHYYDEFSGCFIFPATEGDSDAADLFGNEIVLAGQAERVESGVQVNGVLADRYALGIANLSPDGGFVPSEISLESGDLYLARNEGYITRLVLAGTSDGRDFNFQGEASFIYTIDFMPLPDDSVPVLPEGCRDAAVGGQDFPRTTDAFDIITLPEGMFYKSRMPITDIADLYRTEMPAQGWTLVEETLFDALATLVFEREDKLLTVNVIQNDDEVTVTLSASP